MSHLSVQHAAQQMGVSSATLRNWVHAGLIQPVSVRPLCFSAADIAHLQQRICSKQVARLRTRANKAASTQRIFPEEYANQQGLIASINTLADAVVATSLNINSVMFLAALHVLCAQGEVEAIALSSTTHFDLMTCRKWRRPAAQKVMQDWLTSLFTPINQADLALWPLFDAQGSDDYLGLLYQTLCSEGQKSTQGSYFTPTSVVQDALVQITLPIQNFLDPCCGSGKYLVHAAKILAVAPTQIFGFDIDAVAVYLAKINLLLACPDIDFTPNVQCLDSLSDLATGDIFCSTNHLLGAVDCIATNPPWGAYKNNVHQALSSIQSAESFALFLAKSIALLRNTGQLSFILPESFLNIKIHAEIREFVLQYTQIRCIALLGRQFTGVFTPVIRLDVCRKIDVLGEAEISIHSPYNLPYMIPQSRFLKNTDFIFDVNNDLPDQNILRKIEAVPHTTLQHQAVWALGIVTGNNSHYVLDYAADHAEPIYRGSDVQPYVLSEPRAYVHFRPEKFQQVAHERYYRAPEKLLYKFISKRLVFAYDNQQQLSLNSANILIPQLPYMRIKVVLAFLNSSVLQYVFMKKFSTHKVLKSDLEKLPFPILDQAMHDHIEQLADQAIQQQAHFDALDACIFSVFALTSDDQKHIMQSIRGI